MSHCVYTGFLLQYRRYRYLYTSVCHDILRYMYRSYPGSYIWGTICSEGSPSWLSPLSVSRDEFLSNFCETPSTWGEKPNTPCSSFAKGLRFLNMVMTFILTPLSHYNSITKSRARFLLSLLEDLSIDFPSHFITSILDVYQDTATRDKLICGNCQRGRFLGHMWELLETYVM